MPPGGSLLQLLKAHGRVSQRSNGWTAAQDALLGTLPDEQLALRIGRTLMAVAARRRQLGVPLYRASRRSKIVDGHRETTT